MVSAVDRPLSSTMAQLDFASQIFEECAKPSVSQLWPDLHKSVRVSRMAISWCSGCSSVRFPFKSACHRQNRSNVIDAELLISCLLCSRVRGFVRGTVFWVLVERLNNLLATILFNEHSWILSIG